ncbi:unnamed protein product [Oikopleura dioica]|uniref:Uncharacterized protein n=1 Tax=Oikopleura dioica TaxID=34765 RepID=E4YUV3_OIKDI|nr:unnamed protein product [Oikopleura dioica]
MDIFKEYSWFLPSLVLLCAFSFTSFLICAFWRVISNNVFFRKAPTIPIKDNTYNIVQNPANIHQTTLGS